MEPPPRRRCREGAAASHIIYDLGVAASRIRPSQAAWFDVKIKLFYRISYPSRRPNYSRPRIAPAIAEDCYTLVVFYLFYFPPQIFRHRWADFRKILPRDTVS